MPSPAISTNGSRAKRRFNPRTRDPYPGAGSAPPLRRGHALVESSRLVYLGAKGAIDRAAGCVLGVLGLRLTFDSTKEAA
jgi:hypothetical protein